MMEGLTSAQVAEQIAKGKQNLPVASPGKTTKQIIYSNLFTFFNLIFLILGICALAVGSIRSLSFLPIIIANILIGIVQEIRSKKKLDKLTVLNAPKAKVIRDGKQIEIATDQLVQGDVVLFEAGCQICADAQVLQGTVQVNESLLTGESDEIKKDVGDNLMSGSFVVSGNCYGTLTRVGGDSYISKLTLEAKASKGVGRSEMMKDLDHLIKLIGIIIVPIGLILLLQQWLVIGTSFQDAMISMIAALIGMIPEGLYLLASVALFVSVMRLAQRNVLVHEMSCIETLARVNVLCVDKTGTITTPDMKVCQAVPMGDSTVEELTQLMSDYAAAQDADNITMEALKEFFNEPVKDQATAHTSFSSEFKYSSVTFGNRCVVVGAAEFILRDEYATYKADIEKYSSQGYRTLLITNYDGVADGHALTQKAHPIGLILLENPIRESAPATFAYFEKQGVEIKVISGDNPVTVSRIATQAGVKGAENYVDATTLHTPEEMEHAIMTYTVFGRVTPAQKREFVHGLKRHQKTVAMTGDGVNDILALKDADCSIAMASGSQAAAQTAQLVLLNSDFSCMPDVVAEGRRVINNIQRSASLFLVKNIFSMIMAVLTVVFALHYPITSVQMSLISGLCIGIPAFFLALEPNHTRIEGRFLKNIMTKAMPAGLTDVILVFAFMMIGLHAMNISVNEVQTGTTILLCIVGMIFLAIISFPLNKFRTVIIAVMTTGIIISLTALSFWFQTVALPMNVVILIIVLGVLSLPIFFLLQRIAKPLVDFLWTAYGKCKAKLKKK